MATFTQRIQLTLPPWWGTAHPRLDSLTAGYGAGLQRVADQTTALRPFMRLDTAVGELLDIAALDFYGNSLSRRTNEADNDFRERIKSNLFKIKGVRWTFERDVTALANNSPIVIDPRRPQDTGTIGSIAQGVIPTVFCNSVRHDCVTSFKIGYQWFVRLQSRNSYYSRNGLLAQIAALMPAATVCWINLAPDDFGVYYRGVAVTYKGQRLTFGAT